jgi:hypothetical protein
MLYHTAYIDLQIPRNTLLRQKRSDVLPLGRALSVRAPNSGRQVKRIWRGWYLSTKLRVHISQYDVLRFKEHRNCIWNYGWKTAEKSAHRILVLHVRALEQRFSNFFQVGTTFISQNVLRTTLLLSPLKANCLRFSTIVCDTHFTLILFFLSFLTNAQSKRTTRAEPEDQLWSADHSLRNAALETVLYFRR